MKWYRYSNSADISREDWTIGFIPQQQTYWILVILLSSERYQCRWMSEWEQSEVWSVEHYIAVTEWQLKYNILQPRPAWQCIVKLYHNNTVDSTQQVSQWPGDLQTIPCSRPPVSSSIPRGKETEWKLISRSNGKYTLTFYFDPDESESSLVWRC